MPQANPSRRVLIVDATPGDRALVARLLARDRAREYQVEEAATGADGLAAVRAGRHDCVLIDRDLPDLDVLAFLDELARLLADGTIPAVVVLTARDDETLADDVLKRGAQDVLVKGRFTGPVLRRQISDAVIRAEMRGELDRLHREARDAIRQKDDALARQARTEAQLRHQLDLIETVARTTTEGLCMVDRRGLLTFVNPAAEAVLGAPAAALIGTPLEAVLTLIEPDDGANADGAPRPAAAGWAARGGDPIPVACSSAPIWSDGEAVGTVLAIRDVTEQRRVDAELRRRATELIEAARRKDEFLATLAHELRNPLAPILNAMRIIGLRGGNDPAEERTRAMVEQQVRHMTRLIDDLLDMSRISRGTIQLRREPTPLADAVERALGSIRHQLEARGQALEVDLPDGPVLLDADPTRLDQILINLLTNAAKYTDANGRIRLRAAATDAGVEIRVADSGVGIAPEFLPRIFDLFAQADGSLDRSRGGLGIGLTLVRDLVERHGGSISAMSEGLGHGSEFVVRLPVAAGPHAGDPSGAVDAGPVDGPGGDRPLRIMVVDDNVHAAQSLEVVLQLWGHEVMIAHDGPSALDAAPLFRPEVILLDIGLPGMDGYRVAELVRRQPALARTAILAMTGYAGAEDRQRSAAAGFARHLVKPLDLDALELYLAEFEPADDAGAALGPLEASET